MRDYDSTCPLWSGTEERYYKELDLKPASKARDANCVRWCLATLTGKRPEDFRSIVNTQDPILWSRALERSGMKLAYCCTDFRRLKYYRDELLRLDDVFMISYYSPLDASHMGKDPDQEGWICGSHIVILHGHKVFDSLRSKPLDINIEDPIWEHYAKRIFRVVPVRGERKV